MTSPSVVTLGETMALVRTTEIGSLRHANSLAFGIGGAESNVAIGLVRLGIPTSWLGRVGDDSSVSASRGRSVATASTCERSSTRMPRPASW